MSKQLTIQILTPEEDPQVIDFLQRLGQANPSVLGYHYPFYREMLQAIGVGHPLYLGAWRSGELVGLLPGFIQRRAVGTVYSSLPFFGPNAGVLCAANPDAERVHAMLLQTVLDYLQQQPNILSASFYTPFGFQQFDYYESAIPQALVVPKFTQYLFLPTAVWRDSSLRRNLNKATRNQVIVSTELVPERVGIFWQMYRQNCQDSGIPLKPRQAVEILLKTAMTSQQVSCYFALHHEQIIAGLLLLWGGQTVSYYIPCSLASARTLQAGPTLVDYAVKAARQRGMQYWNWEASPSRESGVYRYKQKWGALEQEYRIYVVPFRQSEDFRQLGSQLLAAEFPYYFVYPYDQL